MSIANNFSMHNQTKTLILDNIDAKYIENILRDIASLSSLSSLVIITCDSVKDVNHDLLQIFRLRALKYCKLSLHSSFHHTSEDLPMATGDFSRIEQLVIKHNISFNEMQRLLSYVPQLRRLSLHNLSASGTKEWERPVSLINLTHLYAQLSCVKFHDFELLIKALFRSIKVLYVSYVNNNEYLNAKRWEDLISSSMPCLCVFGIYMSVKINQPFRSEFDEFKSSFWLQRGWCFEHQDHYNDKRGYYETTFYSTRPYRRKEYILRYRTNEETDFDDGVKRNENAVRHIYILNEEAMDNYGLIDSLHHMISLKNLTKLHLRVSFSYRQLEKLIELLSLTVNLETLELSRVSIGANRHQSLQDSEKFRSVSTTNTVKNVILRRAIDMDEVELLLNLCRRVQRFEINSRCMHTANVARLLTRRHHAENPCLVFISMTVVDVKYLEQLKKKIDQGSLLNQSLQERFHTDPQNGLASKTISDARDQYGDNKLTPAKKPNYIWLLFKELCLWKLIRWESFYSLFVTCNSTLNVYQQLKSIKIVSSFSNLLSTMATVRRDGEEQQIDVKVIVPGDIITIKMGERLPTDCRFISCDDLKSAWLNQSHCGFISYNENIINSIGMIVGFLPMGLPSVVTLVLTTVTKQMHRQCVLVKSLQIVDTFNSVSIIATDGTDTLTQLLWNKEENYEKKSNEIVQDLVICATLCNNAEKQTVQGKNESENYRRNSEEKCSFTCFTTQFIDQIHDHRESSRIFGVNHYERRTGHRYSTYKTNENQVATLDDEMKQVLGNCQEKLDENGYRVIAMRQQKLSQEEYEGANQSSEDLDGFPSENYCFLGLFSLLDPPRDEVPRAVLKARQTQIRIAMVTGDHPTTAKAIAKQVTILSSEIIVDNGINTIEVENDSMMKHRHRAAFHVEINLKILSKPSIQQRN
ncbi:unnamed protein product [Adineta ricciae]|uniref:Uncharacterized protein n=1 Tax=Adineta ricciae TaxID=249248 RepID=A0A815NKC8_ADIRI|nr:unnamed protein product [Adineta ricciae]